MVDMTRISPTLQSEVDESHKREVFETAVHKMLRDGLEDLVDENTELLNYLLADLVRAYWDHRDMDHIFDKIETVLFETAEDRVSCMPEEEIEVETRDMELEVYLAAKRGGN